MAGGLAEHGEESALDEDAQRHGPLRQLSRTCELERLTKHDLGVRRAQNGPEAFFHHEAQLRAACILGFRYGRQSERIRRSRERE